MAQRPQALALVVAETVVDTAARTAGGQMSATNVGELLAAVRQIDSLRAENVALRAEVEKWKACRVHDVDEKEWLREQMIALRAALGDQTKALSLLYNRYNDRKGIPYILSEECRAALDRARALLAEGKA
jgi:hypothetical protein